MSQVGITQEEFDAISGVNEELLGSNDGLILWSDDYFIDLIERHVKNEINMKFFIHNDRNATKEEYQSQFKEWVSKLKCNVTNFDLGIYD